MHGPTLTSVQLFFRNVRLGHVLRTATDGRNGEGLLVPTPAYCAARSSLQTLTSKIASLAGSDPVQVNRAMSAAHAALASGGLQLRDDDGTRIPTTFLMVSDYYPLDCAPDLLGTALPLLVTFELSVA